MNKKYQFIIGFFLIFFSQYATAGNDKNSLGAKAGGMGGASVTNSDAFSIFANQAGLARINAFSAALYGENRFLQSDLSLYSIGAALPVGGGAFGIGIQYFGTTDYNEKQLRIGYGRVLFEKLSLGIELDGISIGMGEYGNKTAFTFGIGLLYDINTNFKVGAHIYNPLRLQITDQENDRLPMILKVGIAFEPSDKATVILETEKNMDKKFIVKAGVEYRIVEKLYIRGGFSTNPGQSSLGVGVNLGAVKIDLSSSIHPALGVTPMVSVSINGKKKEKQTAPAQ